MKKCILVIRVNYGILGVMNPFLYVDTEIKCSDEVYFVQFTKKFFQLKTNAEDEKFLHWQFGAPVIV